MAIRRQWNGCCRSYWASACPEPDRAPSIGDESMADRERTDDEVESSRRSNGDRANTQSKRGKDVMHGRSFAGANIAATEREQTRERERIAEHGGENLDEAGEMVTDAEIEAREENED